MFGTTLTYGLLCLLWYTSSALTNTSSKTFLNALDAPVTLTIVQFLFVALWTFLLATLGSRARSPGLRTAPIRRIDRHIVTTTVPMSLFVLTGHLFSAVATSKIPVSTVHTVKALSPIFTVAAYSSLFGVQYTRRTYTALLLLTLGVMLACSGSVATNGDHIGLISALGSTFVFVSQNIFSKRILHHEQVDEVAQRRLDKMSLLFFSSSGAFLLMLPIWLYQEAPRVWSLPWHRSLVVELVFNGTSHAAQNVLAFSLLNLVSPVTYSIASLIKRIFVIVVSILWFGQATNGVQAIGIAMTAFGLYLYDRARIDVTRVDREVERLESRETLPVSLAPEKRVHSPQPPAPRDLVSRQYQSQHVAPTTKGTSGAVAGGRYRAPSGPLPRRLSEELNPATSTASPQELGPSLRRMSVSASERATSSGSPVILQQNGLKSRVIEED